MTDGMQRPHSLGGFWALLAGGGFVALLTIALQPVVSREDCPNYGAGGNASAFADPGWDLYLPAVMLAWVLLVVVEQALPVAWRHRRPSESVARALAAISAASTASCCLTLMLTTVCR